MFYETRNNREALYFSVPQDFTPNSRPYECLARSDVYESVCKHARTCVQLVIQHFITTLLHCAFSCVLFLFIFFQLLQKNGYSFWLSSRYSQFYFTHSNSSLLFFFFPPAVSLPRTLSFIHKVSSLLFVFIIFFFCRETNAFCFRNMFFFFLKKRLHENTFSLKNRNHCTLLVRIIQTFINLFKNEGYEKLLWSFPEL